MLTYILDSVGHWIQKQYRTLKKAFEYHDIIIWRRKKCNARLELLQYDLMCVPFFEHTNTKMTRFWVQNSGTSIYKRTHAHTYGKTYFLPSVFLVYPLLILLITQAYLVDMVVQKPKNISPCPRVFLKNLVSWQIHSFYGSQAFITVYTKTRHWILSLSN